MRFEKAAMFRCRNILTSPSLDILLNFDQTPDSDSNETIFNAHQMGSCAFVSSNKSYRNMQQKFLNRN